MLKAVLDNELSRFPPGAQGVEAAVEMLQSLSELVLSTLRQNLFNFLIAELGF